MIKHDSGFISVRDAALGYGCTPQGIRKAIKENRLDAYKIGEQYAIKTKDFSKFFGGKK